jgi:hypothetical protein
MADQARGMYRSATLARHKNDPENAIADPDRRRLRARSPRLHPSLSVTLLAGIATRPAIGMAGRLAWAAEAARASRPGPDRQSQPAADREAGQ